MLGGWGKGFMHLRYSFSKVNSSGACPRLVKKMAIFTQHLNPITGQKEWALQQEDYDYKQEIARSSYADMLHDKERNDLYYEGIRRCVALLRSQKKEIHVLDIGTGTGLLSMMALSCGVDSVTACEAFTPMAECAKKILEINGFMDKVNLIGKRSTELECGEGKEMPHRANLLVTEVFDTELIGEGAIETFSHAKEHLLTPDALIVPSGATVYAQVVSSPIIRRWNKIDTISEASSTGQCKTLLSKTDKIERCSGAVAVHDIQLSEVPRTDFSAISQPIPVFEFDWSGRNVPLVKKRTTLKKFHGLVSGQCDAVFMWWDLKMDPSGDVLLSCAPVWQHPNTKGNPEAKSSEIPWRDHWMQAIYYLPHSPQVEKGEDITLLSSHDEYSIWFRASKESCVTTSSEVPVCDCGLHAMTSRTRLGQLSDPRRTSLYVRVLKKHVTQDTICLFLSDCCLMAVVAVNLGARHVYIHETNAITRRILSDFIEANNVKEKITILSSHLTEVSSDDLVGPVSLVFSEPYFETSMLPWQSLHFLYRLQSSKQLLDSNVVILPNLATIRGLPVQYRDLWKIRAPLHTCCGFKMSPFDEVIDKASEVDQSVEPQPLWEYPSIALGTPTTLLTIPLTQQQGFYETQSLQSSMAVETSGTLNGLALWAEWHFGPDECLTTGPVDDVTLGKEVSWDMYSRQGIHLFKTQLDLSESRNCKVNSSTSFDPKSGLIDFQFEIDDNS